MYVLDLRNVNDDGFIHKAVALDMTAIPDPDLVSLPAIHEGDVGLGDPFRVTCESVEVISHSRSPGDLQVSVSGIAPESAGTTSIIVVVPPGSIVKKTLALRSSKAEGSP